jgi:chemotaxis protein MotA
MDLLTLAGLLFGICGIIVGHLLEGGQLSSIMQLAAAAIVFGGTFGAVLVSTRKEDLLIGLALLRTVFVSNVEDYMQTSNDIVEAAKLARKETLLALEGHMKVLNNAFYKKVLSFAIDGTDVNALREAFETEIIQEEVRLQAGAKIWSDAGGFAPTIGIIGAVLGLIHVMSNLTDTSKLGAGIAVAFVATIYGVGSANLIFLPIANKIKRQIARKTAYKEMVLEGVMGIVAGQSPAIIRQKLNSFMDQLS